MESVLKEMLKAKTKVTQNYSVSKKAFGYTQIAWSWLKTSLEYKFLFGYPGLQMRLIYSIVFIFSSSGNQEKTYFSDKY